MDSEDDSDGNSKRPFFASINRSDSKNHINLSDKMTVAQALISECLTPRSCTHYRTVGLPAPDPCAVCSGAGVHARL